MTAPAPRRLRVVALALAAAGLVLSPSPAASSPAASSPAAASAGPVVSGGTRATATARAVQEADPLEVVIEKLTPSTVPSRDRTRIRVSGRIANRSDSTWRDLSVYLLTSYDPLTTTDEVAAAQRSDPRLDIGGNRIITPGLYDEVPDLAPGRSTTFEIQVTRGDLQISGAPGVYWMSVQVLGADEEGRLEGADGRARTFLPLVPEGTPATSLALGLQVRNHVVREPTGELVSLPAWQQSFSRQGRLNRIQRLSRTSRAFPLTWVVDPAVLQAAESVAAGNPATDLAADPGQKAAEQAANGGEDGGATDSAELPDEARRAARWLRLFDRDTGGSTVLALPFGDLDVSAADRAGADDLVTRALEESEEVLDARGISSRPVVAPPTGFLSPESLAALDAGAPAFLSAKAVPDLATSGAPVAERTTGGRVVQVPPRAALLQPQPVQQTQALGVRQSLLAQAALHALSPSADQPMGVLLPPRWEPGKHWREAAFFEGLDVPWIQPSSLTGILDRSTASVLDPQRVRYPEVEAAAEVPAYLSAAAQRVFSDTVTLRDLLTEQTTVGDRLDRTALLGPSTWSRAFPGVAARRVAGVRDQVRGWLGQVQVRGPSFVTMSSETGRFPITVVNGLDQPVTIGLRTTVTGGNLDVVTPARVELPAGGRQALRIQATTSNIGIHQVTVQPVTTSGRVLGQGATLSVRSSKVGLIVWVIMGVGAALLSIAIAVRLTRRLARHLRRRRHGAPA